MLVSLMKIRPHFIWFVTMLSQIWHWTKMQRNVSSWTFVQNWVRTACVNRLHVSIVCNEWVNSTKPSFQSPSDESRRTSLIWRDGPTTMHKTTCYSDSTIVRSRLWHISCRHKLHAWPFRIWNTPEWKGKHCSRIYETYNMRHKRVVEC